MRPPLHTFVSFFLKAHFAPKKGLLSLPREIDGVTSGADFTGGSKTACF